MEIIYVLRLVQDRYYVGKTTDIDKRYKQHCDGKGSTYTQKYSPIEIIETRKLVSKFDEDSTVKEYMMDYGIENIRGGSYSQLILSKEQLETLEREFKHASNECFKCGSKKHFITKCPLKNTPQDNSSELSTKNEGIPSFKQTLCLYVKGISIEKIADIRDLKIETIQKHINKCISMDLIKSEISDTVRETLLLYIDGKSASEIADVRKLQVKTIENHLATCIEYKYIHINELVDYNLVKKIIPYCDPNIKLTDIKNLCSKNNVNVSFADIKYTMASL